LKSVAALCGLLLALLLPALTTLSVAPAHAHAVLVASDPVDGSVLTTAPARVSLTFDEPVRMVPGAVQVISSTGTKVDLGAKLTTGGTVVALALPDRLPRDGYTAMWRLLSADGHEISGSVSFGVGQSPTAPPVATAVDGALTVGSAVARGMRYAGMVLCVGVLACGVTLWRWTLARRRTLALVGTGWLLLAAATVLDYVDTGPDVAWYARSALLIALLLAAVLVVRGHRAGTPVFVIASIGMSIGIAAAGHATGSVPAVIATTVHLLAMAVWLGGLCVLAVIVLPDKDPGGLQRWSRLAFGCVAAVVLTGEYQAWRQISPMESLWHTGYGKTLCVKLFLIILMLVPAYLGRRRLDTDRLRRTVPIEAAVGLLVLLATTVLTGQPPARSSFGPPVEITAPLQSGRAAQVHLATTRHGAIPIEVSISGARATAVDGTLSSAEIASLPVHFTLGPGERWHSTYATAPRPGLWTLRLTVTFGPTDAVVAGAMFRTW